MIKEPSPAELLTAGLIHEMRHPLMGIKLGLQLIQKAVGIELTRQAEWPMVLSQVARLEELLRSYQRFLTPEPVGPGSFEVGPVIHQAIGLCMLRLERVGSRFDYLPTPPGLIANGTPDALTHALTNIIFNALDAVGDKGRISVRVLPSTNNDGRIEVRVSDEGVGIAPHILERMFEPRVTTKAADKGSGLGLSIARRMMEAAGGEVALVEKTDPQRQAWATTEFRISLWAKADAPAPQAGDARRSILLVEDDTVIRTMLARGLTLGGYAVTSAASAEEAIPLISSQHFDAVVTDKNLPGASGEDVARAVKAKSNEIAVVLMTGYASRESTAQMQVLGVDAYVTKPFELTDLNRLLGQVIQRRATKVTRPIERIAIVVPDTKDAARLEVAIRAQHKTPRVHASVDAALDDTPDALVVHSNSLNDATKQRLLDLEAAGAGFCVILISPFESMGESINAILLNAAAQLVQPWSDEAAAQALRKALER